MNSLNKNVKYLIKKRKKGLLTTLCFLTVVYAGIQFIYFSGDFSPLKLLSGVENEARRLVRFMSQPHLQCNNSISTNNASTWMICTQPEIGIDKWNDEEYHHGVVYSIGPSSDLSFEQLIGGNLSQRLYIFSAPPYLSKQLAKISNTTSVIGLNIVPNDPADFARNSFDSQTLNSVTSSLKHSHIDILKIDSNPDGIESHEILRFLVEDKLLSIVSELHVVIKLDQVEADSIYSWYVALYSLFHRAGLRLYHTAATDPLCLQATVMQSCSYFLSFVQKPPASVFVMYPPAIDGSYHYEEERILDFLETSSSKHQLLQKTFISGQRNLNVYLPEKCINKQSICSIYFIMDPESGHVVSASAFAGHIYSLTFDLHGDSDQPSLYLLKEQPHKQKSAKMDLKLKELKQFFSNGHSNYIFIDTRSVWQLISYLASINIPKHVDGLSFSDQLLPGPAAHNPAGSLRRKYSEMQRLAEFGLHLSLVQTFKEKKLRVDSRDIYTLSFVRPSAVT